MRGPTRARHIREFVKKDTPRIRLHIILPPVLLGVGLLFLVLWMTAKTPEPAPQKPLVIRASGEAQAPAFVHSGRLTVLTSNSPTTYYEGRSGIVGFEYDLIKDFAKSLSVKPEFVVMDSIPEILDALEQGRGDLAAAGIARTPERERRFSFGPSYSFAEEQVAYRRGTRMPRKIEDLVGIELAVVKGSRHEKLLYRLKERYPELSWDSYKDASDDRLLEMVAKGEIDAAVADSNVIAINRRYHPRLAVAFSLTGKQSLAWVTRKDETELLSAVYSFFNKPEGIRSLSVATERHFGHIGSFDYVDIVSLHTKIRTELPYLRPMFEKAAKKNDIAWQLLAALSFQESRWNECAQSPMGAQGLMMLTRPTAEFLGVCDPLDPSQSIQGGSKYIADMIKAVPDSVQDRECRIRFGLAAYNAGLGHLLDARELARRMGKNPDRWRDIKELFPLLSQPQYYKDLPHGYARGNETVQFVQSVINYRDILEKATEEKPKPKKVAKISRLTHTGGP